jgi:hypothetical protein
VGLSRYALLTRAGCHLCEEMEAVLSEVLGRHGVSYSLVDVDSDPGLRQRFGETVPVLLRDGMAVAKVRVTAHQLERIVRRRRE